jgi:hypothetical protein
MAVLIALRLVIMLGIYGRTPAEASNDDVNASGPPFRQIGVPSTYQRVHFVRRVEKFSVLPSIPP